MVSRKKIAVLAAVAVVGSLLYTLVGKHESNPFLVGAASQKTVWKLFKPQNGRFEVLLPAIPQHVSQTQPTGAELTKYDVFLSQDKEGNVYMISVTDYPKNYDMTNVDALLDTVKNSAMASNTKNELRKSEKGSHMNLPSIDFAIENNESIIQSRAIVQGKTLFVLTVMNRDPATSDADFKIFSNSFVLK